MTIERLTLEEIHELRVRVLRKGTPVTHATYVEDDYLDVVHLGLRENDVVIATSTWFSKECAEMPGVPAVQLKGMAVSDVLQTSGHGRALIEAGVALALERDARVVWARARDSAVGFYEKCGFIVVGDGFVDESTALPHHIVLRHL